jgi:uncharacterized protein YecT (DUF1311 family)
MKPLLALLPLLAASALAADQPTDWSQVKDEYSSDYAPSKAICRKLLDYPTPSASELNATETTALDGCDSEALYYGIGMAPDPAKARKCALFEVKDGDDSPFGGRTMLMTVYANGHGAKRDLDLATHLACQIDGAPAERDGRVRHLAELKAKGWTGSGFDYCDDITSGLAMGYCEDHAARLADVARERGFGGVAAGLSPDARTALPGLRKAHDTFADAHSSGELDLSGTARAAISIAAEQKLKDELLDMLQRLGSGRAPAYGHAQYLAADARLNAAYRKRLAGIARDNGPGGVTKAGVREAQRAWIRYRDAFLAFAATAYPKVSRDSLAAWITDKRIAMLSEEG